MGQPLFCGFVGQAGVGAGLLVGQAGFWVGAAGAGLVGQAGFTTGAVETLVGHAGFFVGYAGRAVGHPGFLGAVVVGHADF